MTAKDKNEANKEIRAAEKRAAFAAFQALKDNDDFKVALAWLRKRFPINKPSFIPGQEHNTHLAAIREGEKDVMHYLDHMLSQPTPSEVEDGDFTPRPTQAVSELGTPTATP